MINSGLFWAVGILPICSAVVPYQIDEDGIFVFGSVGNLSTELAKMYLVFTPRTIIVFESSDRGHSLIYSGQGQIAFQTENQTQVDGFYDDGISVIGPGSMGTVHHITLGVGPQSPLQAQQESVVFVPSSNSSGLMRLGMIEDEFQRGFCDTDTVVQIPFHPSDVSSRTPSQFRGRFFLIDRRTNERVERISSSSSSDNIQILREYLFVPDTLYENIRSIIPTLSSTEQFTDCDETRSNLPIIGLDFFHPDNSNITATLVFYPEDYTTETEVSDTCLLRVWRSPSVIGQGFDPFLMNNVNFRISNTHASFCDSSD